MIDVSEPTFPGCLFEVKPQALESIERARRRRRWREAQSS
jgi:hypothetical protein